MEKIPGAKNVQDPDAMACSLIFLVARWSGGLLPRSVMQAPVRVCTSAKQDEGDLFGQLI